MTPLIVFQGQEDLTCTADRTKEFFDELNTKQKELVLLESNNFFNFLDVGHDVFRDKVINNVSNDIVKFFDRNII